MDGLFQWVKNITYYLIFISLISNLMPGGKYERYLKLFSGAVFVLLVVSPLTGSLNLEGKLALAYEKICLRQDTGEFEQKLWGMEEERMGQVMERYEEAIARDIRSMAEAEGLFCTSVSVEIEDRAEEEAFGQVRNMELICKKEKEVSAAAEGNAAGEKRTGESIRVEPVQISGRKQSTVTREKRREDMKEQEELNGFKRKMAEYYGLEETNIRIQWEDD